jgi:hypothetical protein
MRRSLADEEAEMPMTYKIDGSLVPRGSTAAPRT